MKFTPEPCSLPESMGQGRNTEAEKEKSPCEQFVCDVQARDRSVGGRSKVAYYCVCGTHLFTYRYCSGLPSHPFLGIITVLPLTIHGCTSPPSSIVSHRPCLILSATLGNAFSQWTLIMSGPGAFHAAVLSSAFSHALSLSSAQSSGDPLVWRRAHCRQLTRQGWPDWHSPTTPQIPRQNPWTPSAWLSVSGTLSGASSFLSRDLGPSLCHFCVSLRRLIWV